MGNKLTIILSAIVAMAFVGLGANYIIKQGHALKLEKIQVKSLSSELKELNLKYDNLNKKLDKANEDKEHNKKQIDSLSEEKQKLEEEKQRLEAELQAKAEAKSKLAKASETVVNSATGTSTAHASSGSVQDIIIAAANKYGVDSGHMLRIAKCESTFNPSARNPSPVIVNGVNYGHAEGLFQFIPSTWQRMSTQAGYGGRPVTDVVANANTAAWAFSTGHAGEWECR